MDADLRLCSVADLDVEAGSVDLILTDPPYPREHWPLLDDLATLAATALRPGGGLVVMLGAPMLAIALRRFEDAGLSYRWTHACMTPGGNGRYWPLKLYVGWKPMVWMTNGKAESRRWIEDRFVSRPDKAFHSWGQNADVFAGLVRAHSTRGDLILDPFLGGGTTAVAATLLGRRFVGCDVDEECLRKTRVRLDAVEEYLADPARAAAVGG